MFKQAISKRAQFSIMKLKSKIKRRLRAKKHERTSKWVDAEKTRKLQEQKFVSIRFYLFIFHLIQFIRQYRLLFVVAFSCLLFKSMHMHSNTSSIKTHCWSRSRTNYLPGVTVDNSEHQSTVTSYLQVKYLAL